MPRHVAFLRAINIGGRRASSKQLIAALEGAGFGNVTAFRASGNLIFDADRAPASALKKRIDALVAKEGLTGKVETTVRKRGLVVELLTDDVFFDSGQAVLKPPAVNMLDKLGDVLDAENEHPIVVEGHTDSQPIATSQFPSNWELSGARASAVIRAFASDGVPRGRLSGSLYGAENPVASNATVEGRSRNRRVDVILTRLHQENP